MAHDEAASQLWKAFSSSGAELFCMDWLCGRQHELQRELQVANFAGHDAIMTIYAHRCQVAASCSLVMVGDVMGWLCSASLGESSAGFAQRMSGGCHQPLHCSSWLLSSWIPGSEPRA